MISNYSFIQYCNSIFTLAPSNVIDLIFLLYLWYQFFTSFLDFSKDFFCFLLLQSPLERKRAIINSIAIVVVRSITIWEAIQKSNTEQSSKPVQKLSKEVKSDNFCLNLY